MGETFTAKLVLDTSTASSQANAVNNQATQAISKVENAKQRLSSYFEWGMHMANLWANYIARNMEGTEMGARMQILQEGLSIASAEMSVAMTVKRGISDISAGNVGAGIFQLGIAASMQIMIIDMQRLRYQMKMSQAAAAHTRKYFMAYRGGL
jgi:hypothetical protein